MALPHIFLPVTRRSGLKYRSLGHHVFSAAEKREICDYIVSRRRISGDPLSLIVAEFGERYYLECDILLNWVESFMSGGDFSPGRAAPVPVVDRVGRERIVRCSRVGPLADENSAQFQARMMDLIQEEIGKTLSRNQH